MLDEDLLNPQCWVCSKTASCNLIASWVAPCTESGRAGPL